ncbi:hypothetical protein [Turkeypox virus]|uniref:Uncharacterized protein n=1 Tax=Turkeypox virus TaxID=336486 RepID=A0A0M3PB88_9POXV|nr:hypothetical protein ASN15_gp016 [Turkeypox virus]ALA62390.1 hypothetical protein [Turkeypox virus]
MDITIMNITCSTEIMNYINSIKNLCSCYAMFPDSINYSMKTLLNLRNDKIVGMFKVNNSNKSGHYIKASDKVIVYCSLADQGIVNIRIATSTGSRCIYVSPSSMILIKCNTDYRIDCIANDNFELVIFGLTNGS